MAQRPPAKGDLPDPVEGSLRNLVDEAKTALGPSLRSVVLFGSAAEGRLRPTSDVNVIFVLDRFDQAALDGLRGPLQAAVASIRLAPMFLLDSEVRPAIEAFAAKFTDVLHRRRVLYGPDPFAEVTVPRGAAIVRLKQVLLNLILRARASYVLRSSREEELALVVADLAGPLRTCAETLLDLEGRPFASPKEALERIAGDVAPDGFRDPLHHLSEARQTRALPPGAAAPTLFALTELAQRMRARAEALS